MKKLSIFMVLVLALAVVSLPALAGEMKVKVNENETEENPAEEFENMEEMDIDMSGFKGNGGPQVGLLQLDLTEMNEILTKEGFGELEADMILFGGGGQGGLKKGPRFGGYGAEGKVTKSKGGQTATLTINYGGFLYEHGIWANKKTDIAVGALMGGGEAKLDLLYNTPKNFDEAVETAQTTNLSKKFVSINPQITIHQQISTIIGLDLSAGYLLTYDFGETWKLGDISLDGPLSNFQAPNVNLRLTFGF